jgi:D-xylose transport system substrate-binding protein
MRRAVPLLCAAAALVAGGCGGGGKGKGGGSHPGARAVKVGVLLPDSKSSARWETDDRPFLQRALDAAGVRPDIRNAEGDKATQRRQADQMISGGAKVLLLVNLDSHSGAAIEADAQSRGVKVIDYDRLTLGGTADYYVSFDNTRVGELLGEGLENCLGDKQSNIVFLNGAPTDNNATLFKQGAHSVLDSKIDVGIYKKVAERDVPDWSTGKALTIFERMLDRTGDKIDGVLAANDALGNAAISALRQRKIGPIPVTGQDATLQGIRNILTGDQCMTVYKPTAQEADAAARLAASLAKGETPPAPPDKVDNRRQDVPAVLLTPIAVTRDDVKDYLSRPDFPKARDICMGKVAAACAAAGIA